MRQTHISHSVVDPHVKGINVIHCVADPQLIEMKLRIALQVTGVGQLIENKSFKSTPTIRDIQLR